MFVIERHIVISGTDNIAWLDDEGDFSDLEHAAEFYTYEDAEKHCRPDEDPNNLYPMIDEVRWEIKSAPYWTCPVCGELWSKDDLIQTYDCHGIPFRLVCPDCYSVVMGDKDYDGVYYDEADECIEEV